MAGQRPGWQVSEGTKFLSLLPDGRGLENSAQGRAGPPEGRGQGLSWGAGRGTAVRPAPLAVSSEPWKHVLLPGRALSSLLISGLLEAVSRVHVAFPGWTAGGYIPAALGPGAPWGALPPHPRTGLPGTCPSLLQWDLEAIPLPASWPAFSPQGTGALGWESGHLACHTLCDRTSPRPGACLVLLADGSGLGPACGLFLAGSPPSLLRQL